jgi:hypothetical protein
MKAPLGLVFGIVVFALVAGLTFVLRPVVDMDTGLTPASLTRCFSAQTSYAEANPECLKSTVQNLLQRYSSTEILNYVSASTSAKSLTSNCHDIGHVIGETLFTKEGSLESALAKCSPLCGSGCLHGAVAEGVSMNLKASTTEDIVHADSQTIREEGAKYCDVSGQLCHGIGHVLLLTTKDIPKSLSVCKDVAGKEREDSCFRGVFMESFGSELSVEFNDSYVHVDKNDYLYPCTSYSKEYQHACFTFLTGLHLHEGSDTPAQVRQEGARACATLDGVSRTYCFEGLGYDGAVTQEDFDDYGDIEQICLSLASTADRMACISGVVDKYINYGNISAAEKLCAKMPAGEESVCTENLAGDQ